MSDQDVFDRKQLLTMSADDEELAAQVAGVFLDDIPKQLTALGEAFAQEDREVAERVAHTIKGASATVGGERLRAASEVGERLAREGKMAEAEANLPEIKARYEELRAALEQAGYTPLA
ncbi:MAG: Hpt domain-containing protein [Planctomycetota bacterium]|jgi:HPt (histidine-containing phosphotransfer) domain-containing protein|nr:Hpt domain-containing protein [Planctomycetota bacterium]